MMDDQLDQYIKYLKQERYSKCYKNEGKIIVELQVNSQKVVLKCNVDPPFPYEFPKIYFVKEHSDKIRNIPHVIYDNSLCLFDTGKAEPNFLAPNQLLLESIQKAEKIISDGANGNNRDDFIKEFSAYWMSSNGRIANSFITDDIKKKKLVWSLNEKHNPQIIISESSEKLRYLSKVSWLQDPPKINNITLYVSLDGSKIKVIPKKDIQVIRMVMESAYHPERYQNFMQKNLGKTKLIIMKIYMENGTITVGWIHYPAFCNRGFRKGKDNIEVAYANKYTKKGCPVYIQDCSQSRLFNRGSDGQAVMWNRVAIFGCGSVGSSVAELMMRLGTTDFLLIDNEQLTIENIARHYCGYSFVGWSKTKSIQFKLTSHNPNIRCQCLNDDIHNILEKKDTRLNDYDLIVVAVANLSVENHIIEYINSGIIHSPTTIILWMEPYGIGGHALVINKQQNLYDDLFSESDLRFQYGIVKNPELYLKREAGCESSYMPYSGFMVSMFVHSIFEYLKSEKLSSMQNFLITWIGKISKASTYGITITKEYEQNNDYNIIRRRVD